MSASVIHRERVGRSHTHHAIHRPGTLPANASLLTLVLFPLQTTWTSLHSVSAPPPPPRNLSYHSTLLGKPPGITRTSSLLPIFVSTHSGCRALSQAPEGRQVESSQPTYRMYSLSITSGQLLKDVTRKDKMRESAMSAPVRRCCRLGDGLDCPGRQEGEDPRAEKSTCKGME